MPLAPDERDLCLQRVAIATALLRLVEADLREALGPPDARLLLADACRARDALHRLRQWLAPGARAAQQPFDALVSDVLAGRMSVEAVPDFSRWPADS